MAFPTVGDPVWFKRLGQTPFVRGDASASETDYKAEAGHMLGGRGEARVSKSSGAQSGLSDNQGVPTIDFTKFPNPLLSSAEDPDDLDGTVQVSSTAGDTYKAGQHLGVKEQITDNNPLAPGHVTADGPFDSPTPNNLIAVGDDEDNEAGEEAGNNDEGRVEPQDVAGDSPAVNTIRDIDPNFPSGRPAAAKAGGPAVPVSGTQDFVSETIDIKSDIVGRRLPSSMESAGVVIEIVTVKNPGSTPDGTKVRAGDKLCWVNWGSSAASNPHRTKWNNRMRTTLHASADLILAYD
jgi:hypothetical protein